MKRIYIIMVAVTLFSLSALGLGVLLKEKDNYANRKVQCLAEALPLSKLPGKDTIMLVPQLLSNKSVIFRYNKRTELSHLGVSLFSRETKDMLDKGICDFLERFLLELLLQKDKSGICAKLEEFRVQMWINGQEYKNKNIWSLSELLKMMEMPVNFKLQQNDGRGVAEWVFGNHSLRLAFPLYRELIEGTDKKESDNELYNRLQEGGDFIACNEEEEDFEITTIEKLFGNVYVSRGEKFLIPELTSDRYFLKQKDRYVPLFHKKYPELSLNNLFSNQFMKKEMNLLLTHRQYGHFTPEISISLSNFLEFFKKDFFLACHTGYNKQGELETVVVLNHKTLDYLHMLRFRIKQQDLFGLHPILKGDFYSNIPQHNIKTLLK